MLSNRIDWPCEIWLAMPERIESIPRVTRKDGTLSVVTRLPLTRPTMAPTPTPTRVAPKHPELVDGQRRQDPGQRHDGADREVDRADQDDHRLGQSDGQEHRRLPADVERVGRRQEQRVDDREIGDQHHDRDQRQDDGAEIERVALLLPGNAGVSAMFRSYTIAATTSTSRGFRSRGASTSRRHGAVAQHDDPVGKADQLGQVVRDEQDRGSAVGDDLAHQRVDVLLRPDVEAAARIVEDEDADPASQPLGEDDLLLVAAGERAAGRRRPRRRDARRCIHSTVSARLAPGRDHAEKTERDLPKVGQGEVPVDRIGPDDSGDAPLGGNEADAVADRVPPRPRAKRRARRR